ncbi:hypothetical protein EON63_23425 [archaeon]|nr:MAG: hypothetical protein EON63_23425 [archaeon]
MIPFEQHAYEALITTVKALEVQEFARLDRAVQSALVFFKSASLIPVWIYVCLCMGWDMRMLVDMIFVSCMTI